MDKTPAIKEFPRRGRRIIEDSKYFIKKIAFSRKLHQTDICRQARRSSLACHAACCIAIIDQIPRCTNPEETFLAMTARSHPPRVAVVAAAWPALPPPPGIWTPPASPVGCSSLANPGSPALSKREGACLFEYTAQRAATGRRAAGLAGASWAWARRCTRPRPTPAGAGCCIRGRINPGWSHR